MADSTPVPAEPLHPLLLPQPDRGRVLMSDQTPIPADWLGSCPPGVADGAVAVGMAYKLWPTRLVAAIDAAYAAGLAAGRTAAAADIRAEIVDEPAHENLRMMNAAFALAARVAENGADR